MIALKKHAEEQGKISKKEKYIEAVKGIAIKESYMVQYGYEVDGRELISFGPQEYRPFHEYSLPSAPSISVAKARASKVSDVAGLGGWFSLAGAPPSCPDVLWYSEQFSIGEMHWFKLPASSYAQNDPESFNDMSFLNVLSAILNAGCRRG